MAQTKRTPPRPIEKTKGHMPAILSFNDPKAPVTSGDACHCDMAQSPGTLRAATGDDGINHYWRAAQVEIKDFDHVVTDTEIAHGIEPG
jgi:glutamine synthetase